jgi:transcriptional regulator with XRE-family HTH domain
MLREARRRARLSQTDLARRAGVAQSVISAYEANHREPGLGTLTKLIGATGHQLAVELVPGPRNRLGLSDTRLGRRLRRHRRAVLELTAQRGRNVRVFAASLAEEPTIPWIDVAGMGNHLAHRYFDTAHNIVQA